MLGYACQYQRQEVKENMAADALVFAKIIGTLFQRCLERAKRLFHLPLIVDGASQL